MTDKSENRIHLSKIVKKWFTDNQEERDYRLPISPMEPRYNPWAIELAEIKHSQADTLDEIAEKVDEDDQKRLREIAESLREEAKIKEARYYD